MNLYRYKNYKEYKDIQISTNTVKLNRVFVNKENIGLISDYITRNIKNPKFGICHGTRRGVEQQYFIEFLENIEIIGTEISPSAKEFPNTIEWDFHNVKQEWINNVDFIYSNSLDHSYKPQECLDNWMSCLNKNGLLFLEWDKSHNLPNQISDPFSASFDEYIVMINKKYKIKEIIQGKLNRKIIVVSK